MNTLPSCGPERQSTKKYPAYPDTNSGRATFFKSLLENDSFLADSVLKNNDALRVQIIYTQIDRGKNGKPKFTDYFYNVDTNSYFYPASTVKLPIALLALQKLNDLNIPGLDRNTTMITEANYNGQSQVYNDPTTADGRPTIAHYIKKIFLASDNDAFNRLYEFLGQEYINNTLHQMGYKDAQILHRLEISLSEDENRHTNPVLFYDAHGKVIYQKPAEFSKMIYAPRNTKLGNGYLSNNKIIMNHLIFQKRIV
ncbi:MAG: serine hydrolase [Bacteroidetes bacterium]|nr:serine hydrolase [Bacteroidota bacterium]MBS1930661.1 serine hydrolase [Bacteroidota bacterium]